MMSDSYQAIYDAVRSKISGGDISQTAHDVMWQHFDISHMKEIVLQEVLCALHEYQRPSAVFRPALSKDGGMWCALLGDNLQEGVAGFGETPAKAMLAFDLAFLNERTPKTPSLPLEQA